MGIASAIARRVLGRVLPPKPESRSAPPGGVAGGGRPPPQATGAAVGIVAGGGRGTDHTEGLEVELPVPGSLLLDIREPGELASGVAEGAMLLPMDLVPHHLDALPRDRAITVYCAAGARSFGVAHWLREQGFAQAVSLAGGIGVFPAVDHPVGVPPGVVPGTRVALPPDARADGVPVGPGHAGEVIRQDGAVLEVLVRDDHNFPVRVIVDAAAAGVAERPGRRSAR